MTSRPNHTHVSILFCKNCDFTLLLPLYQTFGLLPDQVSHYMELNRQFILGNRLSGTILEL